jgi:O-antigen/teichoic acid export membrane protein
MKITSLLKSSAIRNFAKLLSANVVAQVIGLLIYPILTRMYAPEDFGLLNLFLSIGGVFTLVSIAEYQYAIVLPKDEKNAISVFHVGFFLLLCSVVLIGISVFFSKPIAALFNAQSLDSIYFLMPIYVLIMGLWNLLNYWYVRQQSFGRVSVYQISQSVVSALGKIIFGLLKCLRLGMVYSVVFAPFVAMVLIFVNGLNSLKPLFNFSAGNVIKQAKEYKNFPLYVMPRGLLNTLGGNLPVLLLTPYFGLSEVGFFGMALTLSFRPINIICSSLYQVLYQKISEKVNKSENIFLLLRNYLLQVGGLTMCLFGVLYMVMPMLVVFLLGEEWQVVSDYIRVFLPWLFLVVLNTSLSFLPDIFSKQSIYLLFEIFYIGARLLALIIGVRLASMYTALLLFSYVGALVLLLELGWFIYMIISYEKARK